ncbi:MAG: NAD-dependent epimerase/dehydratase family protein [Candidatus Heimdallarchaeum endolithica]|uniref:NAD-dependent epimerase/dehydratase family protein n=1 Tax=Candidatus Heimdallarchaeum endolithica TaxID=2876572 RepID=A0A9Y1BSQ4_9ARCH|nr:MAG: NAD-dependent epimerase/dehydratase family protein [Candidatus Heimdallarchaeum endolithica]
MTKRILVTGSYGQIGQVLVPALMDRYGKENIIATGRKKIPSVFKEKDVHYHRLDVRDLTQMQTLLVEHDIDILIHNASVLSATGEKNPQLAHSINFEGFYNALEATRMLNLEQLFAPSSIAAFGPSTPRENTPNDVITRPTTIYGISKVYIELMGEYYHQKYGLDFRSLRYPGVISPEEPGGGTTDWAIWIFWEALRNKKYTCFLKEDTSLPMMYMPDCIKSTIDLIEADNSKLEHRSFNVTAFSLAPKDLVGPIKEAIPEFEIAYEPDFRQQIAESWPASIDDSVARKEWGWKPDYDIPAMTKDMLEKISKMI